MLLRSALRILRDPSSSPGLIAVATVALCEGARARLELPGGTVEALWDALRKHPEARWATLAAEGVGEIAHAGLVREILVALRTVNIGLDLADIALDILSGPAAAAHVSDDDLIDAAERARGRVVYRVAALVRSAAEHRRVPPHVFLAIIETWSRRERPARVAAVDLVDLLPRATAQILVERALDDEHRSVRSAAALKVADVFETADGLSVVRHRITVETDNEVRADLLRAEADLVAKNSDV